MIDQYLKTPIDQRYYFIGIHKSSVNSASSVLKINQVRTTFLLLPGVEDLSYGLFEFLETVRLSDYRRKTELLVVRHHRIG